MNQNYKEDRISELKKDLGMLNKSLERIKSTLSKLDDDDRCDPTEVSDFIDKKDRITKLIGDKTKELRAEEFKRQTSQSDEQLEDARQIFAQKDGSYSGIRNSYTKITQPESKDK